MVRALAGMRGAVKFTKFQTCVRFFGRIRLSNGTLSWATVTGMQAVLPGGTEDNAYIVSAASLLQGFTDVDGDVLAVFGLVASGASVVDNGDGTYTVTPAANDNGPVTLSYSVIHDPASRVRRVRTV